VPGEAREAHAEVRLATDVTQIDCVGAGVLDGQAFVGDVEDARQPGVVCAVIEREDVGRVDEQDGDVGFEEVGRTPQAADRRGLGWNGAGETVRQVNRCRQERDDGRCRAGRFTPSSDPVQQTTAQEDAADDGEAAVARHEDATGDDGQRPRHEGRGDEQGAHDPFVEGERARSRRVCLPTRRQVAGRSRRQHERQQVSHWRPAAREHLGQLVEAGGVDLVVEHETARRADERHVDGRQRRGCRQRARRSDSHPAFACRNHEFASNKNRQEQRAPHVQQQRRAGADRKAERRRPRQAAVPGARSLPEVERPRGDAGQQHVRARVGAVLHGYARQQDGRHGAERIPRSDAPLERREEARDEQRQTRQRGQPAGERI